jgi:hypothetical protein
MALTFLTGLAMFGALTFLPLYQQTVQGASPTVSGLMLTPMMLGVTVTSIVAGQVTTRTGRYKIFPVLGGAIMGLGLYLLTNLGIGTTRTTSGIYYEARHDRPGHQRPTTRRKGRPPEGQNSVAVALVPGRSPVAHTDAAAECWLCPAWVPVDPDCKHPWWRSSFCWMAELPISHGSDRVLERAFAVVSHPVAVWSSGPSRLDHARR